MYEKLNQIKKRKEIEASDFARGDAQNWHNLHTVYISSVETAAGEAGGYPEHYANPNNPGHHFLAFGSTGNRYKALIEDIERAKEETVILSSELLSVTSPENIAELAGRYDTTVVFLLRRQDEYIESMYRELCKSSFCALAPDDFLDSVLAGNPLLIFSDFKNTELRAPLPIDYENLLGRYADLLGQDRVFGIPYDDSSFGGDALEKFCRVAGVTVEAVGGGPRNVSFSPEIVELRRILDRQLHENERLAYRPAFWKLNDTVASNQKGQNIFGTKQRSIIMSHLASSNDSLRERFIPGAGVDWLVDPKLTVETITINQAASLDVSRAVDLTARLMKQSRTAPAQKVRKVIKGQDHTSQKSLLKRKEPASAAGKIDLVGLNFANIEQLLGDPERLQSYIDVISECSLNSIRIPFYWKHLVSYRTDGTTRINECLVNSYHDFAKALPKHMNITGVVVNCHPEVMRVAYLEPEGFAERYSEYVKLLVENFDFLDDIELWNEPNASDFYVSIKGNNGLHRPWTGAEFVEMVIRPGAESLRRAGFKGHICGATFAENGLIGHVNRARPAFANSLRSYASQFTAEFSDNKGHGSFYFQPEFASDVMQALKAYYASSQDLPFDAFGIHPYPYFGPAPDGFAKHSWHLTEDFLVLLKNVGYLGVPIWVTEVGARSLDLSRKYEYDAFEQADFVDEFMVRAAREPSIKKLFWYKYRDEEWDLKQEKSFGFFDHEGHKKPAYYKFRERTLGCLPREGIRTLSDDFGFGAVMQTSSVDNSFWNVEKTETFAYAIPARRDNQKEFALLMSPGREVGSILRLQTKHYLTTDSSQQLSAGIHFRPKSGVRIPMHPAT